MNAVKKETIGTSLNEITNETNHDPSFIAQTFILVIITLGSSFFYLPWAAKQVGILFTIILIWTSGLINFVYSRILCIGFGVTESRTYDECMSIILGNVFLKDTRVHL